MATKVGDMVHGIREKSSGPAGGIVEGSDQTGMGFEQGIIRIEEKSRCKTDNIVRSHEVFGCLVHLRPEAPDQVFVDVAHDPVGYYIRMKIDAGKILADLEQDSGLVEPDYGVAEIELLENDSCVVGKLGDVILEILAGFRAPEGSERVFRGVVERIAGDLAKDQVEIESAFLVCQIIFSNLRPRGLKNAFEPSQKGEGKDDFSEVGVLEVTPEIFGVLPDEVRKGRRPSIPVFCHISPNLKKKINLGLLPPTGLFPYDISFRGIIPRLSRKA